MVVRTAIFLLSILVTSSMFFDFKKRLRLRFKIIFLIVIIIGNIALLKHSKEIERIEERRWSSTQFREDLRAQEMGKAFRYSKEKTEPGLMNDSQETPTRFFDMNYSRIKSLFQGDKEYYLTIYFSEVSRIPDFYNLEEWKGTESILFNHLYNQLKADYSRRGTNFELIEKEFTNERQKCLKAKERQKN
ncbi:MAG: hypothetical protein ABIH42_09645 [Planctomycetota bacterium]